jgi:S1-C subfamily serine protease
MLPGPSTKGTAGDGHRTMPCRSTVRLLACAAATPAARRRLLAFVLAICALPGMARAGGPAITVTTSHAYEVGRSTEHLSGDALQVGARYRVVIVPESNGALSVSATGNKNLFHSSGAVAGRPIQLPFGDGWFTVPDSSGNIRLVASQAGASNEHVISPIDPLPPRSAIFDGSTKPAAEIKARPLAGSFASQDFRTLFNEILRYRTLALRLSNIKEPPVSARSGVAVFRKASPSVVVVLTNEMIGAGVVLASGEVLTSWHVVENAKTIGVAIKPLSGLANPPRALYEAKLVKYDQVADLALIRFSGPYVPPLKLADEKKIEVGHVVHAIGHPELQFWSYTQGVISQIRPDTKWNYEDGTQHSGTVIQTQTPINPGNSGGPLLDDEAAVVGINSYGTEKSQGLNFAVSVSEIKRFLASNENRIATKIPPKQPAVPPKAGAALAKACEPTTLNEYPDRAMGRRVTLVDTNCTGRANFAAVADRSGSRPEFALVDALGEKKVAIKIVYNFRDNINLWIFYGRRDGVPTAYGYEQNGAGRPGRLVAIDEAAR